MFIDRKGINVMAFQRFIVEIRILIIEKSNIKKSDRLEKEVSTNPSGK
jgi:hypothetical protein